MSNTANWSYTNTARVRPLIGYNQETQAKQYGEEYEIACTWSAPKDIKQAAGGMSGANGLENQFKFEIYTEDKRPQQNDLICINNGDNDWQEILYRMDWDMSFFGETPDYKLVT